MISIVSIFPDSLSEKCEEPTKKSFDFLSEYHKQAQLGNEARGLCLRVFWIWRLAYDICEETDGQTGRSRLLTRLSIIWFSTGSQCDQKQPRNAVFAQVWKMDRPTDQQTNGPMDEPTDWGTDPLKETDPSKLVSIEIRSLAFWAAAPKGRCPVEHREEFRVVHPSVLPSVHLSVHPSIPPLDSI